MSFCIEVRARRMRLWSNYMFLHGAICLYSMHTIIAKYASGVVFPSISFMMLCLAELTVLGLYAFLWQKILHRFELSVAYMNKAATLLWSLLWNYLLFHDVITLSKLLGIFLVVLGIILLNSRQINCK